jgi:hypothetical protein
MARTTYVQDKETGKWIEKWEWEEKYGDKPLGQAPMIMSDIKEYRSTIDGSVISSRNKHRQHLREHGCVEVGTETIGAAQKQVNKRDDGTKGVKDAVIDAYARAEYHD